MNLGIHGDERSGKTTFATWLALQSWALGKKVYANFGLYFGERTLDDGSVVNTLEPFGLDPDAHEPPHRLDMGVLLARDLRSCEIFIDEAHGWFDCRNSPSLGNRVMSWFLLQSGKRDINIYYIAHRPEMLDKRIYRQLKIQFHCDWMGDIRHPRLSDHIHIYMFAKNIAQVPTLSEFCIRKPKLDWLWNMFDTRELVPMDPSVEQDLADMFEISEVDGELRTVGVKRRRSRKKKEEEDDEPVAPKPEPSPMAPKPVGPLASLAPKSREAPMAPKSKAGSMAPKTDPPDPEDDLPEGLPDVRGSASFTNPPSMWKKKG